MCALMGLALPLRVARFIPMVFASKKMKSVWRGGALEPAALARLLPMDFVRLKFAI